MPGAPGGRHSRTPAAVVGASLLLTAAATAFVATAARTRDALRFENAVQSAHDRIRGRLDTHAALLHGAAGLFAASDVVQAEDFRAYVSRLDLPRAYPGVQGIGYTRRLLPAAPGAPGATVEQRLRVGGSAATRVWPAGARDEVHAIVYLEPLDARNRAALGYDMHTEPVRRAAMDRARDTGTLSASGAVRLVQEITTAKQPGFLLYLPVYTRGVEPATVADRRARLRGFVYAPFRTGDLFGGIFGSEEQPRVAFRVHDGADPARAPLLVDSRTLAGVPDPPRRWSDGGARGASRVRRLDVGGRTWTIVFTQLPAPGYASAAVLALVIGSFGLGVTALLFLATRREVRAREAAERSDAVRARFFAAMSHELRTPINAILGYNDLLLAGIYGPLAPAQQDGLERGQRAARHLLELVNDVLDISKLEAGKIEVVLEPVRLDALLEELLTTLRPMAAERGCELRLECPDGALVLTTDPRRLRQILLNLLSNATRFGAGHPVVVRCRHLPHGAPTGPERRRTAGDAVRIAVVDAGPGIAAADRERIFEEFVQLPNASPGGTGLGLAISRRLAGLLGGTLDLDSAPGRGSTFCVTLPVDGPRHAALE